MLADLQSAGLQQKPGKEEKKKRYISISDIIMQRCRNILRCLAAHDDSKNLYNLLGRTLMNISCGEDDGLRSSPTIVPRPLDFRTIDLKLAAGAYGGSHEAFREDVKEVCQPDNTLYFRDLLCGISYTLLPSFKKGENQVEGR